jgi:hypothetical protein
VGLPLVVAASGAVVVAGACANADAAGSTKPTRTKRCIRLNMRTFQTSRMAR